MKKHLISAALLVSLAGLGATPARAVSKETIQMMQQLDTLQQMVEQMQQTLDTQTAILHTLLQQTANQVASMQQKVDALESSTGKNLAAATGRMDNLSQQIEALSASLDDAKAQIAKLSEQVAKTQNIVQTLNTPPAQPAAGAQDQANGASPPGNGPAQPQTQTSQTPQIPDADSLYNSGLSSYTSGQYTLAIQAFEEYLQYYGNSDRASNAQFYIGECYYAQKDYAHALSAYNLCVQQYPDGNKFRAAQLKKGYTLVAMGQKLEGERELRRLLARYPGTHEADLARQRLRLLERER